MYVPLFVHIDFYSFSKSLCMNVSISGESPHGIMLDFETVAIKFKFQFCYNIHILTNTLLTCMKSLILLAMVKIVPLLVFYKDSSGIR